MMLMSHHSSNPLEGSPSAKRRRVHASSMPDSEDPINVRNTIDVEQYRQHLAPMFPKFAAIQAKREKDAAVLVDLDEDDEMENEELTMIGGPADDEDDDRQQEEDYDEEENSILQKSPEEQAEILSEIHDLTSSVPQLANSYRIIDRLGTGTFSSVYKAVDLLHHSFDNAPWQGRHLQSSSAFYPTPLPVPSTKVFAAIKRIYVTSSPDRIRNEISIMEDCRGCRNVSQLITAFRHHDQVVAIMPYHRNEDFRVGLNIVRSTA
jgi:cell division control protein 7